MQSIAFTCQKFIWQNSLEFAAQGENENQHNAWTLQIGFRNRTEQSTLAKSIEQNKSNA